MKQTVKLLLIVFATGSCLTLKASGFSDPDSISACKSVTGFYDWYLKAIREHMSDEFKPRFVESKTGMTTLDFSKYAENLKKYNFSDSLITAEIASYKTCVDNLANVKFSEFGKTRFIDLHEDEEAQCDFGNYYRWIGGQEPVDGIRITKVLFPKKDCAVITFESFDYDSGKDKYFYWGNHNITLKKINNEWKISYIGR